MGAGSAEDAADPPPPPARQAPLDPAAWKLPEPVEARFDGREPFSR